MYNIVYRLWGGGCFLKFTVSNLVYIEKFSGMRLIAGREGLHREITNCGILDYDFDRSLKNKYLYSNIQKGQFVLSSFLYAKENKYLIDEAVKNLVKKGVAGLAIRNIYQLPIHDSILRYADAKAFPIFIIENPMLFFDDIIISIADYIRNTKQIDYGAREIDILLHQSLDKASIAKHAYELNPALFANFVAIYLKFTRNLHSDDYIRLQDCFINSKFYRPFYAFHKYRNGVLLLCSSDIFSPKEFDEQCEGIISTFKETKEEFYIGISNYHHKPQEMNEALQESLYASMYNSLYSTTTKFADLGAFRVIFPYAKDEVMLQFSETILEPISQFDAENKAKLLETITEFIKADGCLHTLAKKLEQHENTLRYRFDKIHSITGLNYRNPNDYEQFSMAVKIKIAAKLVEQF